MIAPRFVDANGVKFAYLEQGRGPLVVMVHGFPDTAQTWEHAMPAVAAAGYRVVAPFTRGYHPTAIPSEARYDTGTLGRDILALIDALGEGGEKAIVVGHDWGASAGYSAAAIGPEKIRLLVTVAIPHPNSLWPSPRLLWGVRHFFALRRNSAPAKIRAADYAYIDELWRRWSPAWTEIPAAETEPVKAAFREPGCLEAACAYYKTISPRMPPSHRAQITVPTVAFSGEHDGLVKWRAYEKARHCFEASYEVVQVPGGHFMHREHPTEFNTELVRVLHDHEQRAKASA